MDSHQSADSNPYQTPLEQAPVDAALSPPKLPLALKVVAWLTISHGVFTLLGALNGLLHGRFHMDLSVLCIPAGIGLLKLRRGWRTFTLVMIWLMMLASPLIVLVALFSDWPVELRVLGLKKGPVPDWVAIPLGVLFFLLSLWQYRVLTRWDVKALFGLHGKRVPRPDEM